MFSVIGIEHTQTLTLKIKSTMAHTTLNQRQVGHQRITSLTSAQKGYIFNNYKVQGVMQMARAIGKSASCIRRFMEKYHLGQKCAVA